jgi:hypothetical protein
VDDDAEAITVKRQYGSGAAARRARLRPSAPGTPLPRGHRWPGTALFKRAEYERGSAALRLVAEGESGRDPAARRSAPP